MNKVLWKFIYTLSALVGIGSSIWAHEIYLLTFINPAIPLSIGFISTILVFILIRQHYPRIYNTPGTYFPFFQSLFSVGLLTMSIFILTNYQLANGEMSMETYPIMETGVLGGKYHKPYAIIKRGDKTKELIFKQNPTINANDKIELTIQNGYFGYEIITEQKIVKN